jgi:biotin carboxyl carrier protein
MTDIVTDTRALLRLFRQSGYGDIHLRLDAYELFISRTGGSANPLREPVAVPDVPSQPEGLVQTAATSHLVSAPHLASFVSAPDVGSAVAIGDAIARIELLGEPIDLLADHAGYVTEVLAAPGALVEYAAPLVRLLSA